MAKVLDGLAIVGNVTIDTTSKFNWVTSSSRFGLRQASPTSTLHLGGSFARATRTINASDTATETDGVIFVNTYNGSTGSNNMTVTFPLASGCAGRVYTVKQVQGTGTVSIAPTSTDLIETVNGNYSVGAALASVTMISDGTSWWKIT